MAVFKAVKTVGKLEIETLSGEVKEFDILPMDIDLLKKIQALKSDVNDVQSLVEQFKLFCVEFDPKVLKGIPSETLQEMVQYVVDTASGKKRTSAEKKSP